MCIRPPFYAEKLSRIGRAFEVFYAFHDAKISPR